MNHVELTKLMTKYDLLKATIYFAEETLKTIEENGAISMEQVRFAMKGGYIDVPFHRVDGIPVEPFIEAVRGTIDFMKNEMKKIESQLPMVEFIK